MKRPIAIIFLGPPGSGKSTQAHEIEARFPFLRQFDTGQILEKELYDPDRQHDPVIQQERKIFESGVLNTPSWVFRVVEEHIKNIANDGDGVVFSGSPRTSEEAKVLIPLLIKIYGVDAVLVFHIQTSERTSISRNMRRRICESCGRPLVWSQENEKLETCPQCGGRLARRSLDTEKAMKERLEEYRNRTEGVLHYFEELILPIFEIDGERTPEDITRDIEAIIQKELL